MTDVHSKFTNLAVHPETIGKMPFKPLQALRAFIRLTGNKEDTLQVFVIIQALSGHSIPNGFRKLLGTAEGGREAYRCIEFADLVQNREWLNSFKPGTVGARYRDFIAMRDLSAYGLADESRRVGDIDIDAAHPIAWYARRLRDVHDVWHVLTGYGTDALGEACVVAFTYAQTRNGGLGFIAAAAAVELKRNYRGAPFFRAIWQAWRHGRRAAWLPALDYESLFAEPLEVARERLNILRPTIYESVPREARNAYQYPAEREYDTGWQRPAAIGR